jgi:hypothetical protein
MKCSWEHNLSGKKIERRRVLFPCKARNPCSSVGGIDRADARRPAFHPKTEKKKEKSSPTYGQDVELAGAIFASR